MVSGIFPNSGILGFLGTGDTWMDTAEGFLADYEDMMQGLHLVEDRVISEVAS